MRQKFFNIVAGVALLAIGAIAGFVTAKSGGEARAQYSVLNYQAPGGALWGVGGTLEVLSGGLLQLDGKVLQLDTGTKTATATAGAATLNKAAGVVTSESLSTAAGASYTLTITNSAIAASDQVFASVQFGTSTTGTPAIKRVTPGAGSLVIEVRNDHASAALNGTIKVSYMALKN